MQKGDTLWGISGKFLKDPWRWPEVWRMNREQIRNPHRIYPGDVIDLDAWSTASRSLRCRATRSGLSPEVRVSPLDAEAIPAIPPGDIEPFLTRPLVTGPAGLADAAEIVAGRDERVVRGQADIVYAVGLDPEGRRPVVHLPAGRAPGQRRRRDARLRKPLSRHRARRALRRRVDGAHRVGERGNRHRRPAAAGARARLIQNYVPHAPDRAIDGRILKLARDGSETGRGYVVTLDKGAQRRPRGRARARRSTASSRRFAIRRPNQPEQTVMFPNFDQTTVYTPSALPERARRTHRHPDGVSRVRPRVVRDRAQFDRCRSHRRLRPHALSLPHALRASGCSRSPASPPQRGLVRVAALHPGSMT